MYIKPGDEQKRIFKIYLEDAKKVVFRKNTKRIGFPGDSDQPPETRDKKNPAVKHDILYLSFSDVL
jgi:hypothetical protein